MSLFLILSLVMVLTTAMLFSTASIRVAASYAQANRSNSTHRRAAFVNQVFWLVMRWVNDLRLMLVTSISAAAGYFVLFGTTLAARASSIDLNIDMSAFFDAINDFVPVGFEIYAIPIGIVVAFLLVRFVGNALVRAFSGREL